jgi:integrase
LLGAEATADLLRGLGRNKAHKTIRRDRAVPLVDVWGPKPLKGDNALTRGDVHALLDQIEARAPIQANRTLSCLKAMLNFAVDREWCDVNVAARIQPRGQETQRKRSLSQEELRALWTALDQESSLIRDVARTLILTGARSGEVFGACWSEIKGGWWTIPGQRTKNGLEHSVWLTPVVREILDRRRKTNPDRCDFVFPSSRKGGGRRPTSPKRMPITTIKNAVARLVRVAEMAPWVPHDLRRTCRTWLSDLGVPPHVKDRFLNHVAGRSVGDKHYDAYSYLPEMRAAAERWDRAVQAILKNERIVFGSWEADVQKVKDAMYAETRPANVIAFSRA